MAPKNKPILISKVGFPVYALNFLTERHLLIAGGGGGAKTGSPNAIEVFELVRTGDTCRAQSITRHNTGSAAVMNCTTFHNGHHHVLAAGMDALCHIYQLGFRATPHDIPPAGGDAPPVEMNGEVRRRRRRTSSEDEMEAPELPPELPRKPSDPTALPLVLDIRPTHSIQSDCPGPNGEEAYQKVVRYTALPHPMLLTGGASGLVRAWKYPEMTMAYQIQAHEKEVFDLHIHPAGTWFVTASSNGQCRVFHLKSGTKERDLRASLPPSLEGCWFRNCRFGVVEGNKDKSCLYTSLNPLTAASRTSSHLLKWDSCLRLTRSVATGRAILTCMAVSDDGRFVALGDQMGCVEIYIAFSLQKAYRAEKSHQFSVVGLEFLPSTPEASRVAGGLHDTSVVSVSFDNNVNIHHLPRPATMSLAGFCLLFCCTFLLLYFLLDYFNL